MDGASSSNADIRLTIREEVREFEEREKRKKSVIVKGLAIAEGSNFTDSFRPVCSHLLGANSDVIVENVFCVDREKNIYRITIENDGIRKNLMDKKKILKDHTMYKDVYINRDLTFIQRRELQLRRNNRRQSAAAASAQIGSDVSVQNASSVNLQHTSEQVLGLGPRTRSRPLN